MYDVIGVAEDGSSSVVSGGFSLDLCLREASGCLSLGPVSSSLETVLRVVGSWWNDNYVFSF